jgi:protein involved in polysaccharide export with SLBB domain
MSFIAGEYRISNKELEKSEVRTSRFLVRYSIFKFFLGTLCLCLAATGCATQYGGGMVPGGVAGYVSPGGAPAMPGSGILQASHHQGGPILQHVVDAPSEAPGPIPTELQKVSHPPYTVAPPDVLIIDVLRLVPRPPYRIEALELLIINVTGTLPNQPIMGPNPLAPGQFTVSPDGTVNLGFSYGSVQVGGMTLEEAQTAIRQHLSRIIQNPQVSVSLAQMRGLQQIRGEHLVRPDGTISQGTYGSVYISGLATGQVKKAIEDHLSHFFIDPKVSIDVIAYNSKAYYVIYDGGGFGQQVFRLPATGNETVLDAIAQLQGLSPVSSKHHIWLARPSPVHLGCNQILPVDWCAITMAGSTATNYQLFPGDRIYVKADALITIDNWLSKIISPIERIFGITLLGATTVQTLEGQNTGNGGAIFVP